MNGFLGRPVCLMLIGFIISTGQARQAAQLTGGTITIQSMPSGAMLFIRTGGHNGFKEVGVTPITLEEVMPGLLEYTLLAPDHYLYDGSLWVQAGKTSIEIAEMKPGRVFYVDQKNPTADDSNPGTENQPWKTMQIACETLVAGDTVLVKAGEYYHDSQWTRDNRSAWPPTVGLGPKNSGEQGRPIVLRVYPGQDVYVMSGPSLTGDPRPAEKICGGESQRLLPDGEEMRYGTFTNHAIGAQRGTSWIVIDGFKVYGSIQIEDAFYCLVQNCEIWQGFGTNLPWVHDNNDCIWIEGAGQTVVRNNLVRDNRYHSSGNCTGIKLYRCRAGTDPPRGECIIENNEIRNVNLGYFDKARGSWRNTFRRNIVYNANAGIDGNLGEGESVYAMFYQNVFCEVICRTLNQLSGHDHAIFNNSTTPVLRSGPDFAALILRGADHLSFFNNILDSIQAVNPNCPEQMTLSDRNCFQGQARFWAEWGYVDDGRLPAWQARYEIDEESFTADPMFADQNACDLYLQPDSPCIDKGLPVTTATSEETDSDIINVANAFYFSDGSGIITGDTIQIGKDPQAQTVQVVEVVDEKTLRLDKKVSWKDGDWVTFPFKGEAPDIGAYEYGDDYQIIGPTWQCYPEREF
jgi:hypothetical protein